VGTICTPPSYSNGGRCLARQLRQYRGVDAHHSVNTVPEGRTLQALARQSGHERIQEIENPELASARARALYEAKGYPKAWIEKRLRSIAVRGELTDEWKQRHHRGQCAEGAGGQKWPARRECKQ
jgi:DNA-damage-inducible protein D